MIPLNTGFVSSFNLLRRFGYINCPELGLENIFFHQIACQKRYKNIHHGDKVEFVISKDENDRTFASSVYFVENLNLNGLRRDYKQKKILKGKLIKVDTDFYVKDIETNILIPLAISRYEDELNKNYKSRIGQVIDFRIIKFTKKNKLIGEKIDRDFIKEFSVIRPGEPLKGKISGVLNEGKVYEVELFSKILGLLYLNENVNLEVGVSYPVALQRFNENSDLLIFDLWSNVEPALILSKKKAYFNNVNILINERDVLKGVITNVESFGVFVFLNNCKEGLIHIKKIIDSEVLDNKKVSNKICAKILNKVFVIGEEIEVIVEYINSEKCSLLLDKSNERNRELIRRANHAISHPVIDFTENNGVS